MGSQRARVARHGSLWTVRADARQSMTAYAAQSAAVEAARELLSATGGGELIVEDSERNVVWREAVPRRSDRR